MVVCVVKLGITCMQTYSGRSMMGPDTHFRHLSLDVLSRKCLYRPLRCRWIFEIDEPITWNGDMLFKMIVILQFLNNVLYIEDTWESCQVCNINVSGGKKVQTILKTETAFVKVNYNFTGDSNEINNSSYWKN